MKRFEHITKNIKTNEVMPNTIVARLPLDYADFGSFALTDEGKEIYEGIIDSLLPEWADRVGQDIYANIDTADELIDELDVKEILEQAWDKIRLIDTAWEE